MQEQYSLNTMRVFKNLQSIPYSLLQNYLLFNHTFCLLFKMVLTESCILRVIEKDGNHFSFNPFVSFLSGGKKHEKNCPPIYPSLSQKVNFTWCSSLNYGSMAVNHLKVKLKVSQKKGTTFIWGRPLLKKSFKNIIKRFS